MQIEIRQATLNDLTELQDLFVETIVSTCHKDYNDEQMNVWTSTVEKKEKWRMRLTHQFFIIAEIDSKIVGFGSLENGEYLDMLYVHKDFLRQGIANRLYTELKAESLKLGYDKLTSDVSKTALPFFKSIGFKVIKENTILLDGVAIINYHMTQ